MKRGTTSIKRRRNVLRQVKGYRFGRSKKERIAKEAIFHAGAHAFRHRKTKKRDARRLWVLRINAAARTLGISYSKLIDVLKKQGVALDRKILAEIAKDYPDVFARLIKYLPHQ